MVSRQYSLPLTNQTPNYVIDIYLRVPGKNRFMKHSTLFTLLIFCNIIASIEMAVIGPFFPPLAMKMGMTQDLIGLILCTNPITSSLTTYYLRRLMHEDNRQILQSVGLGVQGLALFLFALVYVIHSLPWFVLVSFLARLINGVGFALYFTPLYATMQAVFASTVEPKVALLQCMNALGYMIGPGFGSFLYRWFGYVGPFVFFGCVCVLSGIVLAVLTRHFSRTAPTIRRRLHNPEHKDEDHDKAVAVSYLDAMCKYEVFICFELVFITQVFLAFYVPIIANFYIETFGVAPEDVGLYLVIMVLGYASGGIILYIFPVPSRYKPYSLVLGSLIAGIAQFFYGPEPWLGLEPNLAFTFPAQVISGFSILLTYILVLPVLNKYICKYYHLGSSSTNISATLFNIGIASGQLMGPLSGGVLARYMGFEQAAAVLGLALIASAGMTVRLAKEELKDLRKESEETEETVKEEEITVVRTIKLDNNDL